MTENQESSVLRTVKAARDSSVFKNLTADVKALFKEPEAWFKGIYNQQRIVESLVLIGLTILAKSFTIFCANWSLASQLNMKDFGYFESTTELILSAILNLLLFFGIIVLTQFIIAAQNKKPSTEDFKMALTIFAYGLLPVLLMAPIEGLLSVIGFEFLGMLTWSFTYLSMMLMGVGLVCQKEGKIQVRFYLMITTILFIGYQICQRLA